MGRPSIYWVPMEHRRRIINVVHHAINRCNNSQCYNFHNYGGCGITVWSEWIKQKKWFAAYLCTLPGWTDLNLSIDRIDNNKGYYPGNLRWVSQKQQMANTRVYTGYGRGTSTRYVLCNKEFIWQRDYQKFCSQHCSGIVGAFVRWNKKLPHDSNFKEK